MVYQVRINPRWGFRNSTLLLDLWDRGIIKFLLLVYFSETWSFFIITIIIFNCEVINPCYTLSGAEAVEATGLLLGFWSWVVHGFYFFLNINLLICFFGYFFKVFIPYLYAVILDIIVVVFDIVFMANEVRNAKWDSSTSSYISIWLANSLWFDFAVYVLNIYKYIV